MKNPLVFFLSLQCRVLEAEIKRIKAQSERFQKALNKETIENSTLLDRLEDAEEIIFKLTAHFADKHQANR